MRRMSLPLLYFWLALLIAGCGGSGGDVGVTRGVDAVGTTTTTGTATVRMQSVLAQSVVPNQVDSFRATGYDEQLKLRFQAAPVSKGAQVEWTGVPVDVTFFVIEYLSNGQVEQREPGIDGGVSADWHLLGPDHPGPDGESQLEFLAAGGGFDHGRSGPRFESGQNQHRRQFWRSELGG